MSKEKYTSILPKGTVVQSPGHSYTIEEVLGQGGFGITYKVVDENNQVMALKEHFVRNKCFRKDDNITLAFHDTAASEIKDSLKEFRREGRLLKDISNQCPNIVRVYEVFDAYNTAYYSMEYLGGGSLRDLIRKKKGPLGEEEARAIMGPIAMALAYLHNKKILHMDIKPDNIVMRVEQDDDTPTPVLIDFGVSLHFDDKDKLTTTHHIAGVTRGFSPIEQYDPVERFAPTVDIYALAATWFYLLAGRNPIAATEKNIYQWLQQNLPDSVSDVTRNAILEGMKFRDDERPQNVEDFIRLMDGSDTIDINQIRRSRRKALLTRIAIAACVLAAVAAGVIWWVNKTKEPPPPPPPPPPPIVTKHYKVSGKMTSKSEPAVDVNLYLDIKEDSVRGFCYYEGQDSAFAVEGSLGKNRFNLIEMNDMGKQTGKFYGDKFTAESYTGHYIRNDEAYFRFDLNVTEIDSTEIPNIPIAKSFIAPKKTVVEKKKDKQTDDIQKKEEQTKSNEGDTPPKTETEKTTGYTPENKPTETPPPATDPFRTKVDSLLRH